MALSKDVIIAGGIVVVCVALIAVAISSKPSKPAESTELTSEPLTTSTEYVSSGPTLDGPSAFPGDLTGSALPPFGGSPTGFPSPVTTGGPGLSGTSNPFGGPSVGGLGSPVGGTPAPIGAGSPLGGPTGFPPTDQPFPGPTQGPTPSPFAQGGPTGLNLPGPSGLAPTPSPQPEPVAPVVTESKTHVVKAGELPGDIALKYLGSAKRWPEIAKANPGFDPRNLKVGQKLVIPATAAPTAEAAPVAGPGERTYTIAKGDNLYAIAKKQLGSGRRYKEIEQLNGGLTSADLKVGKVIRLPASADAATSAPSTGTDLSAAPATGGRTHVVAAGEYLSDISKKYFGTTTKWKDIVAANPGVSPTNLKIGQKLVIPEAAGNGGASSTATGTTSAGSADYVIKSGDTLYSIAASQLGNKTKWKEIQSANPGLSPKNMRVGQTIKIPGKTSAPESTSVAPTTGPGLSATPPPFASDPFRPAGSSTAPAFNSPYASPLGQPSPAFSSPAQPDPFAAPVGNGAGNPFVPESPVR